MADFEIKISLSTLIEAINLVQQQESIEHVLQPQNFHDERTHRYEPKYAFSRFSRYNSHTPPRYHVIENRRPNHINPPPHPNSKYAAQFPWQYRQATYPPPLRCYGCGYIGHKLRDCRSYKKRCGILPQNQDTRSPQETSDGSVSV